MNDALIPALFACIDRGDFQLLDQYFAPEAFYERPGFPLLIGIDRIKEFYLELRPLRFGRHSISACVNEGEQAACRGRFEGELKTGTAVTLEFADFFVIQDGLIAFRKTFFFIPLL
jgi:ketosteroid isomerase-like protein